MMDVFRRMIWMQDETFDVGWARMQNKGFSVIDPDDSMIVIVHEIDPSLLAVGPAQISQGASFDEDDGLVSSILRRPVYGFPRYTFDR